MSNYHMTHYSWALAIYGSVFIYRLQAFLRLLRAVHMRKSDSKSEKEQQLFNQLLDLLDSTNGINYTRVVTISFGFAILSNVFLWPIGWPWATVSAYVIKGIPMGSKDKIMFILSMVLPILFFWLLFN